MDDVYLTDATLSPNSVYYNITLADPGVYNPGGTASEDFHIRFPAGYSIVAGDTVVIAINGSDNYVTDYGRLPDFELLEDASSPDEVPDLVAAFPGSISADPSLDFGVESLILYTWDGTGDLVKDIDYVTWGTNESFRVDKSGVTVGSSDYRNDTIPANQIPAATGLSAGDGLRRLDDDEGAGETDGADGNGITDHDEMGEILSATFATVSDFLETAPAGALAAPSAPVLSVPETNPANPNAGSATTVSMTLDSYSEVTGVTFPFSIDGVDQTPLTGTDSGGGIWTAEILQQAEGVVINWYCEAVNLDGGIAVYPVSAPIYFNSFTVGSSPVVGEGAEKLLITEVNAGPNFYSSDGNGFSGMADLAAEFIEIHNPNLYEVDLSDYYLTDAINYIYGADQFYWNIPLGATEDNLGGGDYNDFHARFPAGFTIGADETITISIAGSGWFFDVYDIQPDLELYEDGATADDIPDMLPVFQNGEGGDSIFTDGRDADSQGMPEGVPELEEHYGEPVILYHWTEGADLVTDIDFFLFGDSKTSVIGELDFSQGFDKTGQTIVGSTYLPDTAVASQVWFTTVITSPAYSYTRTDFEETGQTATGGNGVGGRDETSENFSANFSSAIATPGTLEEGGGGGGGGTGEGAMKLLITEVSSGQNIHPFTGMEQIAMEFIEIHNPNDQAVDLSDYYITDAINYLYGSNQIYYRVALGPPHSYDAVGGGNYSDFHARFPAGYTIDAHGTIVISIGGSDGFESVFSELPDLELYEDGAEADAVPDMVPLFGPLDDANSIHDSTNLSAGDDELARGIPELEEHYGEPVILYHWNEGDDLVTDIDFFLFGDSKVSIVNGDMDFSQGFDKTDVAIGGSTYLPDTAIDGQSWFLDLVTDGSVSYHRIAHDEGDQTATGSNGVDGRDETSEDFAVTFASGAFTPGIYELGGSVVSHEAEKLLITEVSSGDNIHPFTGMEQIAMEFIEIHNPNDQAVDLSDYYITDAINYLYGANQFYYGVALGPPHDYDAVGGGNYSDFHARFPAGYTIDAHGTIVISIGGSDGFFSVFEAQPDLELYEDGDESDDIPDMVPLFGPLDDANSIHDSTNLSAGSDDLPRGIPELEEHYGEPVILYHWSEGDDLVTDIDFFLFGGSKISINGDMDFSQGFDKTDVTMGGSTYLPDTAIEDQSWFQDLVEDGSASYHRIAHDEGDQIATGSNGVDGRDETSEDLTVTFASGPFTPGVYALGDTVGGEGEIEPEEAQLFTLEAKAATFIPREGGEFNFKFKISSENFEFRLRIFDREGRLVRTLFDSRFDGLLEGIYKNVAWDGRNDTYELVRAGLYLAHFSIVDNETGTEETKVMPVVVASRLNK
ncbi:MAG: lamin tail domain-containing protein [Gemmatimonadales bacterium]|nr:lamin tail domain-containing protein [Gemmatimonadales bacterium]